MLMWVLIVLLIIFVTYKLLDHILRLPRVGSNCDRYILITGCDSGFGHELAKRLDLLGCHVFAGCFTETGETELKKICSERMHPVPLDITNHDSITRVFELICNKLQLSGNGLWGVVNNAGTLHSIGPLDWLTVDEYRRHSDVNLFGLINITMTFLPLVKKTRGRIVNCSSNFGLVSNPLFAPYSVSKFGVEAFTDALRHCLKPFGCKAVLIEPGGFRTSLCSAENIRAACDRTWNQCSPETQEEYTIEYAEQFRKHQLGGIESLPSDIGPVVRAYEHALLASYPRPRYLVGSDAVLMAILAKLPEFIGDWILAKRLKLQSVVVP